jgi:hypothetical protein
VDKAKYTRHTASVQASCPLVSQVRMFSSGLSTLGVPISVADSVVFSQVDPVGAARRCCAGSWHEPVVVAVDIARAIAQDDFKCLQKDYLGHAGPDVPCFAINLTNIVALGMSALGPTMAPLCIPLILKPSTSCSSEEGPWVLSLRSRDSCISGLRIWLTMLLDMTLIEVGRGPG